MLETILAASGILTKDYCICVEQKQLLKKMRNKQNISNFKNILQHCVDIKLKNNLEIALMLKVKVCMNFFFYTHRTL